MTDNDSPKEIGLRIKELREAAGWSQEYLAQMVNTNQQTVQRIESGATAHSRATPKILQILRNAEIRRDHVGDDLSKLYVEMYEQNSIQKTQRKSKNKLANNLDIKNEFPLLISHEIEPGLIVIKDRPKAILSRQSFVYGSEAMYALYMPASDMAPEFEPGDTLIVDPLAPPIPNVSCVFREGSPGSGTAVVRRLILSEKEYWRLQSWSPSREIELPKASWPLCHRIIGKLSRN